MNAPSSTVGSLKSFSANFKELYETLQDVRNAPTSSGTKELLLIRALSVLAEANNIMAEQNNRIAALEGLVMTDELTGLLNRRGLSWEMSKELKRLNRGLSKGGLFIMLDLDGFKQVNDHYGHPAGDACLIAVADYLRKTTRSTDIVSRQGGDEFVVVLTDVDTSTGIKRAEQIIDALNWLTFEWQGNKLMAGASHGWASYDKSTSDIDQLFIEADELLYRMKQARKSNISQRTATLAQAAAQ